MVAYLEPGCGGILQVLLSVWFVRFQKSQCLSVHSILALLGFSKELLFMMYPSREQERCFLCRCCQVNQRALV